MKRIALIDDDPCEIDFLEHKFPNVEFHWYIAYKHAKHPINHKPNKFDLVICDINGVSFLDVEEDYKKIKHPNKWVSSNSHRKPDWTNGNWVTKDDLNKRLKEYLADED